LQLTIDISFTRYFIAFAAVMICRNAAEYYLRPRTAEKEKYSPQDKLTLLTFLLSYLISALAVGTYLLTDKSTNPLNFYSGIAIIMTGFTVRAAAMKKISSSYRQSMAPGSDAVLVTDGIYRMIRHPLYLFYAMEMLGLLLIRFNWISLAMLAADLVNTAYRINSEEAMLDKRYGSRYMEYRRNTKRLIPFIF